MRSVIRDGLVNLLDGGPAVLVEALSVAGYDAGHLPGAVNVPEPLTADLAAALAPDRSDPVVLYCSGPGLRALHPDRTRVRTPRVQRRARLSRRQGRMGRSGPAADLPDPAARR